MSLTPMPRIKMQQLKVEAEEELWRRKISDIIEYIYANAVRIAKTTSQTSYYYAVPYVTNKKENGFHVENMTEILSDLKWLFPDCIVKHTLVSRGTDGRLYDISKISEENLPLVSTVYENSYIVIDWS